MRREFVSRWIGVAGFLAIASVGTIVFLRDGSYFLDEASVVLAFQQRSLLGTFTGPLPGGGQDFPRFYLTVIRGVRALLGPGTASTRLLPFLFFLAATALWMRLFVVRFRSRPLFVLLGATLAATTSTWIFYSAVLKQYSLDVFLTLALFSLPDAVLDDALGRGSRRRWIPALLLPILFSYTYVVSLLARVAGWGLLRMRRGVGAPDARSSGLFAAGGAAALGLLWLTDVRHTFGRGEALTLFWSNCTLARNPGETGEILRRFVASWYLGPTIVYQPTMPVALATLLVAALLLGAAWVTHGLVVGSPGKATGEPWGSRSIGCVLGVLGVIATSWVIAYPICAGRLTLYALFFQQILILEGFEAWAGLATRASRPRVRRLLGASLALVLAVTAGSAAYVAFGRAGRLLEEAPRDDLRPALARIREEPPRPVVVTPCLRRQIETLPEGTAGLDLVQLPLEDWQARVPRDASVWILDAENIAWVCPGISRALRNMTRSMERIDGRSGAARLYRAETLGERELRARRRRALRALKRAADARAAEPGAAETRSTLTPPAETP